MTDHKPLESKLADAERRAATIAGMRELADWLEAHPDVPMHKSPYYGVPTMPLYNTWFEGDPLATSPKRVARAMGKAEKEYYGQTLTLRREFSGGVFYSFNFDRNSVCKPKMVGRRDVVEKVCTDEERAKQLQAELDALHEDRVVGTEPVIEYDCKPVLS